MNILDRDWMNDELEKWPTPSDLCRCRLNSLNLMCHRDGPARMFALYGPSWQLPLGIKALDKPDWPIRQMILMDKRGYRKPIVNKIKALVNVTTGRIEAEAVNALAKRIVSEKEMALILAQLNVWTMMLVDAGIVSKKIYHSQKSNK